MVVAVVVVVSVAVVVLEEVDDVVVLVVDVLVSVVVEVVTVLVVAVVVVEEDVEDVVVVVVVVVDDDVDVVIVVSVTVVAVVVVVVVVGQVPQVARHLVLNNQDVSASVQPSRLHHTGSKTPSQTSCVVVVVAEVVVCVGRAPPRRVVAVVVVVAVAGLVEDGSVGIGSVTGQSTSYSGQHTPNSSHVSKQKHPIPPSGVYCGSVSPQWPAHVNSARMPVTDAVAKPARSRRAKQFISYSKKSARVFFLNFFFFLPPFGKENIKKEACARPHSQVSYKQECARSGPGLQLLSA